ncbi:zinc finger protein ZFP2-like isoform X1 [Periplaneta americana]|uniref:zinc finger protein ZFP2-like isoform X1 n=1 Tax=Periplaneta americana TaxID=6978 RepID=UPI0037E74EF7
MDVVKKEPEVDPLAIQCSDNIYTDEKKPLSEEGNLSHLEVTGMKTECVDHSYVIKSEIKVEDTTPVPVSLPMVESDVDEDLFDVDRVQWEQKVEVSPEEHEVLSERIAATNERTASSEIDSFALEEDEIPKNSCSSRKPVRTLEDEKQLDFELSKICFSNSAKLNGHLLKNLGKKSLECDVCVVMDAIKTEPEVDPLAVQPCDDAIKEEENTSPDEETAVESKDSSSCCKWEVKIEESSVPITFSMIKSEPEEETFDMVRVEQVIKVEVTTEESEALSESTLNTDWNETPHVKCTIPENCLIKNGVRQSTPEPLIYHQFVRRGNDVESKPDIQSDERSFKCDVCGELLQSAQSLEMHMRTHTSERTYDCDTCGKYFLRYSNLLTHLSRRNCDKPYSCDVCGKIFAKHKCLTVHARTHSVEKPFKCDVCGKSFAQSGDLIVHIRRHSGERPFKCSVCGKSFVHSGYVTIHERTHSGEKPFKCDVCGKRFVHSSASRVHARTHTGEKPYKCNICGKCFATSHQLTIHLRTHSGEKPFMCHICGKCFIQSSALTLHSRTHSGEKPHKCNVCGKCFASWSEVRVHARSHTGEKPYKCDICGKCFVTSSDLTVHSRTHSGEKPFKCSVCGKCFSRSTNLSVHTRLHSAEKPFKCDVCGKCFVCWNGLKRHECEHPSKNSFR